VKYFVKYEAPRIVGLTRLIPCLFGMGNEELSFEERYNCTGKTKLNPGAKSAIFIHAQAF